MILGSKNLSSMMGYEFKSGVFDKAILVVGSTEYHGDHLPYRTDTVVAEHLAKSVVEKVNGIILLPPLHFGMSEHYSSFPVAISLSTATLTRILRDVFTSLLRHEIKNLLIINGHDGNIAAIETAAREFRVDHPEMRIAVLEAWWETGAKLLPEGTFEVWGGLGHAGEGETSMMLAVAPELVAMRFAQGVVPHLPAHVQVKWRFEELTTYGVTGDPTKATLEKGKLMRGALVELLVTFIKEMEKTGWNFDRSNSAQSY